jgi:hypothetical protein
MPSSASKNINDIEDILISGVDIDLITQLDLVGKHEEGSCP